MLYTQNALSATGRRRFLQNKTKTVRHQNTFVSNTQNILGKYKHPIFLLFIHI